MPRNELIFAWLLTIDKSYDVLQLGGGTPKWGKFGPKNEISNDLNCSQNILRDRPDIYREAYHTHQLPSIRGMKATTQNGGNLSPK